MEIKININHRKLHAFISTFLRFFGAALLIILFFAIFLAGVVFCVTVPIVWLGMLMLAIWGGLWIAALLAWVNL